ncbi:Fe-S cluster assembly protein SufD [Synechocystis sp. LKSZ1]|uniref:Fe-S cluster assembly protein SufD n=1 Tax=Synechocystis sp. LKSZ1 TaxID=3144951 RepID=UPI00336C10A4
MSDIATLERELRQSSTADDWAKLLRSSQSKTVAAVEGLNPLRQQALSQASGLTLPSKRDEEWRFTDLADLVKVEFQTLPAPALAPDQLEAFILPEARHSRLVFINGAYNVAGSDLSALPASVFVGPFSQLPAQGQARLLDYLGQSEGLGEAFTVLNTAGLDDVAVVWLPPETLLETPVHLLFLTAVAHTPALVQPRLLVVAEDHSRLTLAESYGAVTDNCSDRPQHQPYFNNIVAEIFLGDNAQLTHLRNQRDSGDSFHIAKTAVNQQKNSHYQLVDINLGAKLSRHNLDVVQQGEQTTTQLFGLTAIAGRQVADTHSAIYLRYSHGTTEQLHKTIVDDYAHGIFNGKVLVPQAAQLTNAAQLNRNLLLSSKARINTKPELQITADNVKCSHGATVSQLEADELFYLRSRGLNDADARHLLIDAFAGEILQRLPLPALQKRLEQCIACRTL